LDVKINHFSFLEAAFEQAFAHGVPTISNHLLSLASAN
jgi:hypothetical protein